MQQIEENVDLRKHTTMRLGGKARFLAKVSDEKEIPELVTWAKNKKLPMIMIGQGSNIVWRDEGFEGLVLVNNIQGKEVLNETGEGVVVKFGAGENWDEAVSWSVERGWSGIEFLSLIPGLAGSAPIQNIGAYGVEIADTLVEVEAYDIENQAFGSIMAGDCQLTYRSSRFKTTDKGRFFITAIVLRLRRMSPMPPFYETLQAYLRQHNISEFSPKTIREAVIAIRQSKLPDPEKVANNGSFFLNPIVSESKLSHLQNNYPDIKSWSYEDKFKLSAGWLIDQAGFKNYHDEQTGIATWPTQSMTLVNEHAKNTADLLAFKQKIVSKVQAMFDVTLEQEPELLP